MGPEGAVNILYKRELDQAGDDAPQVRAEKVAEYREKFANPYIAAERGFIDAVIEPRTHPAARSSAPCASCAASATPCRPRSTATFRSEAAAARGAPASLDSRRRRRQAERSVAAGIGKPSGPFGRSRYA